CTFAGDSAYLNSSKDKPFVMKAGLQFTTSFKSALSEALLGMRADETKEITVSAEDAFGEYDSAKIIPFPIKSDDRIYRIGDCMRFKRSGLASPESREGTIAGVHPDHIDIDTNHPMAGRSVAVKIRLISFK